MCTSETAKELTDQTLGNRGIKCKYFDFDLIPTGRLPTAQRGAPFSVDCGELLVYIVVVLHVWFAIRFFGTEPIAFTGFTHIEPTKHFMGFILYDG